MNKHCFRLVFNRARGCLMAVGEAARAQAGGVHTAEGSWSAARAPILIRL